ncbi:hypothetical protein IW138_003519 [Coemansia sp. RSA 986]|nr:hypothetical protein IW138_003519 [Coemansia sp. RSA 986]
MSAKGVLRTVKNYTKGYSPMQMKAREATSNDLTGPSTVLMSELAQATYNESDFLGIMEMIDKRMNDKGKYWRHVFKALVVLRFLLINGAPYVAEYAIDNLYIVRTLREFQHIDDSGYDRGANVREKAKELTVLLSDRSKIEEQRKHGAGRANMGYGDPMVGYNRGYASSSSRIPYGGSSSTRIERRGGHGRSGSLANASNRYGDDDSEMRRAIAESKRSESSKKVPRDYDEDAALRKAIEASAREAKEKEDDEKRRSQNEAAALKNATSTSAGEVDLLGSFDDDFGAGPSNTNNIGMMSTSTSSFSQQPQQQQMGTGLVGNDMMSAFGGNQMGSGNANFDPFGLSNAGDGNNFNAFGSSTGAGGMGMVGSNYSTNMSMAGNSSSNMFNTSAAFDSNGSQLVSQKFMSTTTITETSGAQNPFGQTTTTMPSASTNNLFDTGMGGGQTSGMNLLGGASSGFGGNTNNLGNTGEFGGASGAFGSAFDGGMAAKALPFGANTNDPNSRLAEIARNSEKIDPFASLALESTGSAGGSNPFSGASANNANASSQAPAPPPPAMFMNIAGVPSQALITPSSFVRGTGTSATPATSSSIGGGGLGSALVDLSPSALASSSTAASSFGQVNRNPFASGAGGASGNAMMGSGASQPSLNQLMSGAGTSSSMASSANMFGQQQMQNPNAMLGGHNSGGFGNMQSQPQQPMMYQSTTPQTQQQQQINPFAQSTTASGMNNQTDLFGL